MDVRKSYFCDNVLSTELFDIVCGKKIGEGEHRTVFECSWNSSLVIKFEHSSHSFSNMIEWEVWSYHAAPNVSSKLKQWLAPCHFISPCGAILIQSRTWKTLDYPDKVPKCFSDLKLENFGMLEQGDTKRFVCHDYGLNKFLAVPHGKEVKTKWWSTERGPNKPIREAE